MKTIQYGESPMNQYDELQWNFTRRKQLFKKMRHTN